MVSQGSVLAIRDLLIFSRGPVTTCIKFIHRCRSTERHRRVENPFERRQPSPVPNCGLGSLTQAFRSTFLDRKAIVISIYLLEGEERRRLQIFTYFLKLF